MSKIEKFEDLKCWQLARELVKAVYIICKSGPITKDFGTQDQIKRASVSVMNNIAEGFSRFHRKEFIHFLDIAQSSAAEVKSMTYILEDIDYINSEEAILLRNKSDQTQKLVRALIKYLSTKKE